MKKKNRNEEENLKEEKLKEEKLGKIGGGSAREKKQPGGNEDILDVEDYVSPTRKQP